MAPPERLSFGVEMEFYVAWYTDPKIPMPPPPGFESKTGGPILIQEGVGDLDASMALLTGAIRVTYDISMSLTPDELQDFVTPKYGWAGVEVVSPALWATDEGFAEVRTVCEYIQNHLWTLCKTGLHIHVGCGNEWFSIRSARQIAALLYAGDPVLTQLHPKHRRTNRWCPSPRLYSKVSMGKKMQHAPEPPSQLSDVSQQSTVANIPGKKVTIQPLPVRPTEKSYEIERDYLQILLDVNTDPEIQQDVKTYNPIPIMEAVNELLKSTARGTIAELMGTPLFSSRPAYNFQHFRVEGSRTIEFRQPTGTVDAAEVVSQARIAVHLCEFGANASIEQLLPLLLDFEVAEQQPAWYNVYDLLADLNLHPEAKVVYAAFQGTVDEKVRREYWEAREPDQLEEQNQPNEPAESDKTWRRFLPSFKI
ncbi:uncharacterized protein F4822DRAFT_442062 [Hypoxylon trugodes]|uniref:uncharacterized protein n=1 Tax=Hypoxylon trugodes TaxID=326681 RepID=UPI00218E7402|nr:uncharacterized protein F4822DRAFT_442062 [Hypoxylon trugodes]KAI1390803.1 hypothetical protein F4822DRAFT_442062 [Hypoxylon trugodes]